MNLTKRIPVDIKNLFKAGWTETSVLWSLTQFRGGSHPKHAHYIYIHTYTGCLKKMYTHFSLQLFKMCVHFFWDTLYIKLANNRKSICLVIKVTALVWWSCFRNQSELAGLVSYLQSKGNKTVQVNFSVNRKIWMELLSQTP